MLRRIRPQLGATAAPPPGLEALPPAVFAPFRGPDTTIAEMRRAIASPRGEKSLLLRSLVEDIVRGLQSKDYLSEILACRNFVASHVRYANDPTTVEWVKDPQRLAEEIAGTSSPGQPWSGIGVGDCDDMGTLLAAMGLSLGREAELVTVGFGEPGSYSHVFARIREPKSKQWIVVDPVAGSDEQGMLDRVTTYRTWTLEP